MEYGAVVVWWLVFAALAAAGAPIAGALLPRLPDRGAGLAIPVATVVLVLPVYWIGQVAFGTPAIWIGLAVLGLVAGVAAWRGASVRADRVGEALAVFTLGFLLVVAIRAVDPSIHAIGGEKFLDFGLLNALLRSSQLPPEDMWFAGEPVAYYYGGHLIAAVLAALTDTSVRFAYNLALAGFYGMLMAAAYGLAGSLAAVKGGSYRFAGAAGAVFVGLAANLVTPLRTLLMALPDGMVRSLAGAVADATAVPERAFTDPNAFSYWTASRVIPDTINEFPLFAWLNGDLHAHMMSTPFLLVVVGVAFAYYLTPAGERRRRQLLAFGAIPPVAGLLAVINTWSFPTVIGVAWLTFAFAPADPASLLSRRLADRLRDGGGVQAEVARFGAATAATVAAALLGVTWTLPFFLGPASGRTIAFFPDRTGLLAFVLVHGQFLAVFGLYLGARTLSAVSDRRDHAAVLVAVVVVFGLLADAAAVALVVPLLVVAWVLLRRPRDVGYETVLFAAGAGLVLLVEFAYLAEQAGPGRMNTVFKIYMQVWVLWGVAAGAAFALLGSDRLDRPAVGDRRGIALAAFSAILLFSMLLYGSLVFGSHFAGATDPTLDATQEAQATHPAEWEAIRWLDQHAGRSHIVTAPGCWCNPVESTRPYRWVNAPSSFTGIPTVAGWSHEVGYRGEEVYRQRVADVETIYTGEPAERAALLDRYDVRYVYVGPNERALYGDVSFEGHPGAEVAFRNDAVTIYRVERGAA